MPKVTPFLWFDGQAEEAMQFYVSLFDDAKVIHVTRQGDDGPMQWVNFEVGGQEFMGLNGGPQYKFSPATSFFVSCDTQAEIDRLWDRLADGGTPNQCGWIDDRFGVTWQVVPASLGTLLGDPDPERASRVMQAMLGMVKMDIAGLEAARDGR